MVERWDVFVSYAHEDEDEAWVRVLAENLRRAGCDVFFDQWDVVGGSRPEPIALAELSTVRRRLEKQRR